MGVAILKFLTLLISASLSTSNKRLLGNPGFDSADSWESGYLPCALEEVVFPETYPAVLPLPTKVDISGIVLPRDGALLLSDESTITLGGELQQRECQNGRSRRAYLKMPVTRKWYNPSSWLSPASQAQNTAIPHLERVPCDNETVVMPRSGPLSIDLENVPYLRMGHLNLAGSLISNDYLNYLIHTDIGQLLFKNSLDTMAQYYHQDPCGCHIDALVFSEPICKNVAGECDRPHCLVPVTPLASCCPICGSVLSFQMDYCSERNLNKLRELLAASVQEQELTTDLDYHITYVNAEPYGNYLEAIIVDREAYSEKSVKFVAQLNASTDWSKVFERSYKMDILISGRPYNPNITFGSVLLIILCLMFVSVVALVIFAHYAPDHRYLRYVPQWVYDPRRWRALLVRPSVMFARFDNVTATGAEADATDGIAMGYDAESGQVRERAFDNPMFGEKLRETGAATTAAGFASTSAAAAAAGSTSTTKAAMVVGLSKATEQKVAMKSSGNKLESVTLVDAMEGGDIEEEQELTEITLGDSSANNSDDEEETKE
ncbi:protein amnionless-like [Rhagoletis pomonella]|uniref:protein amnionless-like n=1 Tax=Rhagoletis pomonella TaxID=28610 RepID=UPI0017862F3B|nr:protein amnionless-like [Rhagoletis pomonella]